MATTMCTVEVNQTENALPPFIVQFSNGQLQPEATEDISFQLLQNKHGRDKLLVADTENMSYMGRSGDGSTPFCKNYIAVVDKRRHKVKVVPTQFFWMNPVLESQDSVLPQESPTVKQEKENRQENADSLTMAFGSKKKKRAMESRIRHKVEINEVTSLMQKTVAELEASSLLQLEDSKPLNPVADLLPSVNRDATNLEDVYDIQEIIPAAILDSLTDGAADLSKATQEDMSQWMHEGRYARYVLNQLAWLPLEEAARLRKAKLLLYMNYMIYTSDLKAQQVRIKDPFPEETPGPVKQFLLDTFFQTVYTPRQKRSFPAHLKDKLIGHIVVLGLIVSQFKLNMTDLQVDVKVAHNKLQTLVRALGARLETVDNTTWAVLKLPLATFSEHSRPMMKRKKK